MVFVLSRGVEVFFSSYFIKEINLESRMIIPSCHGGESERSWVAFFNEEAEEELKKYLLSERYESRLFRISH